MREKFPYSELFWSTFSCIWTEYGEILRISPYSVRMRENADQNNSEYGYVLHSALYCQLIEIFIRKTFVSLSSNQILLKSSLIFFRSVGELNKIFLTFQNCDLVWNSQLQEFAKNSLYQEISYSLNKHLYIEVVIKKWRDLKIFQKNDDVLGLAVQRKPWV